MNILFFLTPKNDIAYIYDDSSLRQTLEKMEYHRYTALPMIQKTGEYVGTITEGDLLWGIKNQYNLNLKKAEDLPVSEIMRRQDNEPVPVTADIRDVIEKSMRQNFVPVVDDRGIFIGIITRKKIIQYFYEKLNAFGIERADMVRTAVDSIDQM